VDLKTATDVVNNIVTSSAVVIGGVWAYFKFVRGRTFARRAELAVSPAIEQSADSLYLSVTITLKNAGLSKLPLNKDMKVVRLFGIADEADQNFTTPKWERISTLPILDQHDWLEAQETVTDMVIYSLQGSDGKDSGHAAYQVEAIVGAPRRRVTRKGTRWQSRAVVFLPAAKLINPGHVNTNGLIALTTKQLFLKMIAPRRGKPS
jgi:hypothetical protein